MDNFQLTGLDLAVVAVIAVSSLLALFRGFVKEVLSVAGIVAAGFATLYLLAPLRPYVRQYVEPQLLADGLTGVGIFVVTLVLFSLVSHAVSSRVRDSALGPLDRALGVLFGAARGAVIVCLAYLAMTWIWDSPERMPPWAREARSLPLLQQGGDFLRLLIPSSVRQRTEDAARSAGGAARTISDTGKVIQNLQIPDSGGKTGYKPDNRPPPGPPDNQPPR